MVQKYVPDTRNILLLILSIVLLGVAVTLVIKAIQNLRKIVQSA
jgi:hypothetical protein